MNVNTIASINLGFLERIWNRLSGCVPHY